LFSRTVIATSVLFAAFAASAAAITLLRAPDLSIYMLLGAGVLALVLLRRRTS
jgi:hypothetical protein